MNTLAGRIRLDFRSDEPIVAQIVRQVQALVAEGTLRPGDQLPTVRELAIDLRINFSTVARAYRILDEQRLISTQRGRGTYIWDEGGGPAGELVGNVEGGGPGATPGAARTGTSPPSTGAANTGAGLPSIAESGGVYAPADRLAGLAQRYIREASGLGAPAEQIEEVFRQQWERWKQDHPALLGKSSKG